MPARNAFEYAVIRVVPRVERGECLNIGVVLFCRQQRFLQARMQRSSERIGLIWPHLDLAALHEQLDHIELICAGGSAAGPIGVLPIFERFRWITAPRSTVVQTSPVHAGICDDPNSALERIFQQMVA